VKLSEKKDSLRGKKVQALYTLDIGPEYDNVLLSSVISVSISLFDDAAVLSSL